MSKFIDSDVLVDDDSDLGSDGHESENEDDRKFIDDADGTDDEPEDTSSADAKRFYSECLVGLAFDQWPAAVKAEARLVLEALENLPEESLESIRNPLILTNAVLYVHGLYLSEVPLALRMAWALEIFNFQVSLDQVTDDDIMIQATKLRLQLTRLHLALGYHGSLLTEKDPRISEVEIARDIFSRAHDIIECAKNAVYYVTRAHDVQVHTGLVPTSRYADFRSYVPQMKPQKPNTSHMIEHLLNEICKAGLLRLDNQLMKQQIVAVEYDDEEPDSDELVSLEQLRRRNMHHQVGRNRFRYGSRAYVPFKTISEYTYEQFSSDKDITLFREFTSSKGRPAAIIDYIEKCTESRLPVYKPHRHMHAFQNGIYIPDKHIFLDYTVVDNYLPKEYLKYHCCSLKADIEFDAQTLVLDNENWSDFDKIRAPLFDHMLEDQFGVNQPEVIAWFYALVVGKMLYELEQHDNWQVLAYLYGLAGTGKSTIIDVVSSMYEVHSVEVLGNEMEKTFGLSILNKDGLMMYTCPEVRPDFKLPQATFQSLVSGDPLYVATKGKDPKTRRFKLPGIFAGNTYMDYQDTSKSVARRIVTFKFDKFIDKTDTGIKKKIRPELPYIMVKGNLAYRYMVEQHGRKSIWDVLPEYFQQIRKQLEAKMNPIQAFMLEKPGIELRADGYISLDEFKMRVNNFIQMNGLRRPQNLFTDSIQDVFRMDGISKVNEERDWFGVPIAQPYILGINLKLGVEPLTSLNRTGSSSRGGGGGGGAGRY